MVGQIGCVLQQFEEVRFGQMPNLLNVGNSRKGYFQMFVHIDDEVRFLPNILQRKAVVKFLDQVLLLLPQKLILLVPHFIINIICYNIHSHPYPIP